MNKLLYILVVILAFMSTSSSCQQSKPTADSSLNSLNEAKVYERLGQPNNETILTLKSNARLLEYRGGLYDVLDKLKEDESVQVKEAIWNKGDSKTAVWFKQVDGIWKSFDNLKWSSDTQF